MAGHARDILAAAEPADGDDDERTAREEAAGWLRDRLLTGPVPAGEVKRQAERNGFAWRTMHRARESIGGTTRREGFGNGSRTLWALPEVGPDAPYVPPVGIDAKKTEQEDTASMGKAGAYGPAAADPEAYRRARDGDE